MARKPGLGRGLDALIPPSESALPPGSVTQVPVKDIQPNPRQPRERFDEEKMAELAASIIEHGVIQPLIVTQGEEKGQYTLIAGERRWQAAKTAGMDQVPVVVREASEQQFIELALIENVQRADLNPLETAEAYRQLADEFSLSHEDIAGRVGKSRVAVTNTMRLLKLPKKTQESLMEGHIREGHARALLALSSAKAQNAALQTVLLRGLNVRQTEELVRKLQGKKKTAPPKSTPPPEIREMEERLRSTLGTKVQLKHGKKGGAIVIYYYSDEELNGLIERFLGELD